MTDERTNIKITASPHVRSADSTIQIMWSVVISLVPVIAASIWFFGPSAILVLLASVAGCLFTERLFGRNPGSIADGSAMITGLLLGLTLPPGFPLWMAFLGGIFGMGFGKIIYGGLGQNIFNPALVGRAFLQAAFPVAITTWPAKTEHWWMLQGDNFALPFMSPVVDTATSATPLGNLKFGDDPVATPLVDLLIGTTGGSLGETSALLIILGGIYLAYRGHLNWHIPVSILVSTFAISGLFYAIGISQFTPAFMLVLGRFDARRLVHGDRHGDLAFEYEGLLGFRYRNRFPGGDHPGLGRSAGRCDVRHPADECHGAFYQPRHAAPPVRHLRKEEKGGCQVSQENNKQDRIDVDIKLENADSSAAQDEPAPKEVSTFRLVATLTVAGALAGLLIVLVNLHTKPIIDKYKAEQLQLAVYEVLPGVERYDTFYLVNGDLSLALPAGAKESEFKRVYVGRDENGQTTGVAISRGESGFQDVIMVIFGYDPVAGTLVRHENPGQQGNTGTR